MLTENPNLSCSEVQSADSPGAVPTKYSGQFINGMIQTVAAIDKRGAYTRSYLANEIEDLGQAYKLVYEALLKFGCTAADSETARAAMKCYHVGAYLMIRRSELREILKGCCPHCEFTPCQFNCAEQLQQHEAQRLYDAGNV